MDKIRINLYELLLCLSNAEDMVSPHLSNHHQQVACLSFRLAEYLNLPSEQQKNIFFAALVHDIGAISLEERLELIETESPGKNSHAFKGSKLLEKFLPLQAEAKIIKYHHLPWNNGKGNAFMGEEVPLASHVIHLADRTCAMADKSQNILSQLPMILSRIRQEKNSVYEPSLVDALEKLCKTEYIWLDLMSREPVGKIPDNGFYETLVLDIDDVISLALVFSQIIDFRSSFTACHSAGVAKSAQALAQLSGFSPMECKMMLISGYLHDLGKLALDNSILEKPAKLSEEEFNNIRTHTYYTYQLLKPIKEFKTINEWASYHHERIDGKGYPFHISGDNLSLGSRIMAVADVFTAITEDRPYRKGMDDDRAKKVLCDMSNGNALDKRTVDILIDDFEKINSLRKQAQQDAVERYNNFLKL